MSKPQISSQGEYDGACFLYSITNAYKALTGKKPSQEKWDDAIQRVPYNSDFLVNVGTANYDDDMALYEITTKRMLKCFAPKKYVFDIKSFPEEKKVPPLQKLITENSVVILIEKLGENSEHWLTAVDFDEHNIYFANSWKLVNMGTKYSEQKSPTFNRIYNDSRKIGQLDWIYHPSVLQVSKQ